MVKLTGQTAGIRVYSEDGENEIAVNREGFSASPGIYKYVCGNKAEGYFEVTENTKEITLALVDFTNVKPDMQGGKDPGNIVVYENNGKSGDKQFLPMGSDGTNKWKFVLPQKKGEGFFTFCFTPYDMEHYLPVEGHFYVYRDTNFSVLNLSDSGKIPWIENKYITIKAPIDMEVLTTWQLKLYMARNYQVYEAVKKEGDYCYYKVPIGYTFILRQTGKVTRYCEFENLPGAWNDDHTEFTLKPLEDDPNRVIDEDDLGYYASMMTNLPENSTICLKPGEYFDIVPLRAWQAISNSGTNQYNDPEWHYKVIGNPEVISPMNPTEDDKIGQYGRVRAQKEGTVLVAFWYDAMETHSEQHNDKNNLHLFSALKPELTGIAVVHVSNTKPETEITTNIDMIEGRTVYYLKSLTDAQGNVIQQNNSAEYTFTPTAETNGEKENDISVYIYETQYIAKNGSLSINSWDPDGGAFVPANGDGSYTLNLKEGRNIIRIEAGDAATYHVILARGIDVTVDNLNNKGNALATGDTAQITIENLIPPIFKQGAIYNPSSVTYNCRIGTKYSSRDFETPFGQYMAGSKFNITLLEEDEGTFTVSEGAFSASAWGAVYESHRNLTRNSMTGYWSGGDNPDINYGKLACLPEISFTVESNDELEEAQSRSAGLLKMLWVKSSSITEPAVAGASGPDESTDTKPIPQTDRYAASKTYLSDSFKPVVGAALLNGDKERARLLVRYWSGADDSSAKIKEQKFSEITIAEKGGNNQIGAEFLMDMSTKDVVANGQALNVEVIVIPENGTPMTYARYLYDNSNVSIEPYYTHHLTDLQLNPVTGYDKWNRWDGILKAKTDIIYNGEKIDLGYGFIGTESRFTASVPYETDKISFTAEGYLATTRADQVIIKVDTDESNATYCVKADKVTGNSNIPLKEGLNKVTITYQPQVASSGALRGQIRVYTIEVERRTPNKNISFKATGTEEGTNTTDLTDFDVFLMNSKRKTIASVEDNPSVFSLENGEYTYYVSSPGYGTVEGELTVDDENNASRTVSVELEKLKNQEGTATVKIAGQDSVVCQNMQIPIPEKAADAEDLAEQRYVQYNYGGYTVLHALIDACNKEEIGFRCYRGSLTPDVTTGTGSLGAAAGWVCEVNGEVKNPATTRVKNGDVIEFYYNAARDGMCHVWLEPEYSEVKKDEYLPQTLYGRSVCNLVGNNKFTIAGAEIYDGEVLIGKTDSFGKLTIDAEGNNVDGIRAEVLGNIGEHYLTAVKKNADGENIFTATLSTVKLLKDGDTPAVPGKVTVSFRLIGDAKHGAANETDHAYTTWIKTRDVTIDPAETENGKVTVGDVFKKVFNSEDVKELFGEGTFGDGIEKTVYEGLENNYISSINAPKVLGGYNLAEKDNGKDSGWMYTVNGEHPDVGLNAHEIHNGDQIIWHYVDEPSVEVRSYNNSSQGSPSTWNTWVRAEDVTPGAKDNASRVDELIDAIGEVTEERLEENEKSIHAAREAYDALTDEEKSYVTELDILQKAEADYAQLRQIIDDRIAVDDVVERIQDAFDMVEQVKVMQGGPEPEQMDVSGETEGQEMSGFATGAEGETDIESAAGTDSVTETQTVSDAETETAAETVPYGAKETEKETEAKTEAQAETGTQSETETQAGAKAQTESQAEEQKETLGVVPLDVQTVQAAYVTTEARMTETQSTEAGSSSAQESITTTAEESSSQTEDGSDSAEESDSQKTVNAGTLNEVGSSVLNSIGTGLETVLFSLNGTETGTMSGNAVSDGSFLTGEPLDVTLENAALLTRDARLAYESLTPHQRELVHEQNIQLVYEGGNAEEIKEEYPADTLLVMTEEELAQLMGAKAAVEEAEKLIGELPEVDALTVEDVPYVRKAAAVYEAARKVLAKEPDDTVTLDEELAKKLDQAAARAKLLEDGNLDQIEADKVIEMLKALGTDDKTGTEEKIYLNRSEIIDADTSYSQLNDNAKALVEIKVPGVESKLAGWMEIIKKMNGQINTVAEQLEKLFEKVDAGNLTLNDETDVTEAGEAYDGLTPVQLQLLAQREAFKDINIAEKLGTAENIIAGLKADQKAAQDFVEMVAKYKGGPVTKTLVEALKGQYDKLSDGAKALIPQSALDDLAELERQAQNPGDLTEEQKQAYDVAAMVEKLPAEDNLTLADKASVESAQKAYDALSSDQKAMIKDIGDKLVRLGEKLAELEAQKPADPDGPTNPTNPDDPVNPDDPTNPTNPDDPTKPNNPTDPAKPSVSDKEVTLTYSNYPVTINGKGLEGCELTLKALSASDSDVKKMQEEISSKEALIRLYDITLYKNGREIQPPDTVTINFQVGTKYNGDTLTVLHVVDGKVKSHKGKVSGGVLPVEVDSLSPFGVVVNTSTVTLSNTNNGTNNGTTNSKDTLTCGNYPVSVTGKGFGDAGYTLKAEQLAEDNEAVKLMRAEIGSDKALIRLFDITLYKGDEKVTLNQSVSVNFQVGTKYNGEALTVLHVVDGKVEKLSGIVSSGVVSVTVDSLSPFGVVVDKSTLADDGTLSRSDNGASATGGTSATGSGARTGDDENPFLYVIAMLVTAGIFAGLAFHEKKRARIEGKR